MNTNNHQAEIETALKYLVKEGGVITVPTDTTYGLVCRIDSKKAVERIYEIKQRDWSKPLIILASSPEDLLHWTTGETKLLAKLGEKFWPGALTIIAWASQAVPTSILAGKKTVGLRVPNHAGLRALLTQLPSGSVASTSANISGQGIPKDASHVKDELGNLVDYMMGDCGQSPDGTESTIIDITSQPAKILRNGALDGKRILSKISE